MSRWRSVLGLGLPAILAIMSTAFGPSSARYQDDPEERALRGRLLLQNDCFMCHTAEIIASQRLTADQWKAEITKMIGWGAPVTADEQPILLDYLIATYGPDVPPVRPNRISLAGVERSVLPKPDAAIRPGVPLDSKGRGAELYRTHCAACHGPDALGGEGGTNLIDRPVMTQLGDFREVVLTGRNRMPSFRAVLDAEQINDIFGWMSRIRRPR